VPLEEFIVGTLDDPALRAARAAALARTAVPLRFPRETLATFPGAATPSR
jgi:hypothetical protein